MTNNKDLDFERNTKLKYEDLILKLKEELMKKEFEINFLNTEYNDKLSHEAQIKADVLNENKLLIDKIEQIEKKYEEKYKFLEGNYYM